MESEKTYPDGKKDAEKNRGGKQVARKSLDVAGQAFYPSQRREPGMVETRGGGTASRPVQAAGWKGREMGGLVGFYLQMTSQCH